MWMMLTRMMMARTSDHEEEDEEDDDGDELDVVICLIRFRIKLDIIDLLINTAVVTNVISTCYFALGPSQFHQHFDLSSVDGEAYFTPERSAHRIRTKPTRKGPEGPMVIQSVAMFGGRLLQTTYTLHTVNIRNSRWKWCLFLGWSLFRGCS